MGGRFSRERDDTSRVREAIVGLLSDLVRIDSVNPSLVDGGAGEGAIAAFVAGWASDHRLEVEWFEETAGRPSVVVRSRGAGGGRTLLLCGHTDTVSLDGVVEPLAPKIDGDRCYGRGAYDMKAGLAAALVTCAEARRLGLSGDVVVAAVADEEHASIGIQDVLLSIHADAAIVTEPTELDVLVAHRGFAWAEIEVIGRAAHGSRPDSGVDAIAKSGPILTGLMKLDESLERTTTHPLLGRGSVHASVIAGGVELSSYPARCVIGVERRTLPGESAATFEVELDGLLDECRAADPQLEVARRTLLDRDPFSSPEEGEIVATTLGAARAEGAAPAVTGAGYWADSALIAAAGIPTVLFGPGGAGAHEHEEWVSIADTELVARTLIRVAQAVCV
jgi:acetylornithine deacetylase